MTQEKPPIRRLSVSVSTTSVLTLVVLVVAAMTCAYIWGVIAGRASEKGRQEAVREQVAPEKKPEGLDTILQAHELEFTQVLRGEKPVRPEIRPPAPEEAAPRQDTAQSPPAAPEAQAGREEPPQDPEAVHDYIFQMAALRDEQAVDSLRQKLEGFGLRTRMEQSGKVFIVLVALRGNAARAAEIGRIATDLRLGAPLLRSKKPVAP